MFTVHIVDISTVIKKSTSSGSLDTTSSTSLGITYIVVTLRPAAVSRACKYVGPIATSSTNVLYDVSPSSL